MSASTHRPRLLVIVASTRPGRVGLPVSQWFVERARNHAAFEVEVADLAVLELPFMDEAAHPRLQQYEHAHTLSWSRTVDAADAVVLVMPEYNHGYTAPLKNALDYLHNEWAGKPIGFVSYGGVAGGTRAVQLLKPVLAALRMVPALDAVHLPMVFRHLGPDGFRPGQAEADAAAVMLNELLSLTPPGRS